MKRKLCLLLALILLIGCSNASALSISPAGVDRMFITGIQKQYQWRMTTRTSGGETTITEEASINGHNYSFRVIGDAANIYEIKLTGWFNDLAMNGPGTYPDPWFVYISFVSMLYDILPDSMGLTNYLDWYGAYDMLKNGDTYGASATYWTEEYVARGRVELRCSLGGYIVFSVQSDGYYSILYTSH